VNRKVLSLACAVTMSVALLSGCGQNDGNAGNNGGTTNAHNVTGYGAQNRNTQGWIGTGRTAGYGTTAGQTGQAGQAGQMGQAGQAGQGRVGANANGSGTAGSGLFGTGIGAGMSGRGGAGASMFDMSGRFGGGNGGNAGANAGTGMRGLSADGKTGTGTTGHGVVTGGDRGTATRGQSSMRGLQSALRDDNALVLGNLVITSAAQGQASANGGKTAGAGANAGAGGTLSSRYANSGMNVLQVTDAKAIKALKRVKAQLKGGGTVRNATKLSSDIQLILKSAKPMRGAQGQASGAAAGGSK